MDKGNYTSSLKEQCWWKDTLIEITVNILSENGQILIRPVGYGQKYSADGEGWLIGLEIRDGKLRLIIFDDISKIDPQIIDLEPARESRRLENERDINYVDYRAVAQYLAKQGRRVFTGCLIGGSWNARCLSAWILSKKRNDKAAYEFLLEFGDKLALALPGNEQLIWQDIKNSASAMLKPAKSADTEIAD